MKSNKKPSVLSCVTSQYDCDRIINAGFEIAKELGYELHVLCVHTPMSNASLLSDEIEYLYQTSKRLGADMTIAFNNDAPQTTADFAKKINAKCIVTGIPDGKPFGFIDTLHSLLPKSNITMVTKNSEHLTYNKDCMVMDCA
ncbi:MAG: hypothetical protein IJ015_02000 [Ruminococcus sp.]|nr:hypothetical protein [Ruminococcus sp.]